MISDGDNLGAVRYVISIAAYNIYKAKYKPQDQLIPKWIRKLCEDLAFDYSEKWPEVSSLDNPLLCEFCGTQIGTHYAHAYVNKGHGYNTCCKQQHCRIEQPELFWYNHRLTISCAIATYMNVPHHIIQHCMALELIAYLQHKKDITSEQRQISSTDGNGFERISSLF